MGKTLTVIDREPFIKALEQYCRRNYTTVQKVIEANGIGRGFERNGKTNFINAYPNIHKDYIALTSGLYLRICKAFLLNQDEFSVDIIKSDDELESPKKQPEVKPNEMLTILTVLQAINANLTAIRSEERSQTELMKQLITLWEK